ncbi:MAG: hypothetical protein REI94_03030 [Moraxellaceae bacterium]|nr:hypothetical protein [Moraxellaceae bacterium]
MYLYDSFSMQRGQRPLYGDALQERVGFLAEVCEMNDHPGGGSISQQMLDETADSSTLLLGMCLI